MMAYTVEQLEVIVDAKIDKAINGLKKTEKATKSFKDSFIKSAKVIAGPLAAGAIIATTVKMASEFSKAASDAEEIGSKYNTIFRDMRTEADAMAENFANNFGLASSSAKELLGNTADLLTGLGFTQDSAADLSVQVNSLAADLASFSNFEGGTRGASEALTKALLGEAESAKALGIVINQNTQEYKDSVKYYTEVEGKTLLQAKAFTALKMATEQSGNAIGDVARTWESHANVQRRLQESTKSLREELGKQVNEGLTPLLSLTDKIVRKMADWAKEQNKVHDAVKNFKDGTADGKDSVIALNEQLKIQIIQMQSLNQAQGYNIAGTKEAIEYQKEQIEQTKTALALAQQKAQSEALDAKYNEENAKAAAVKAEKDKQAREQAKKDLENLKAAFSSTREGQIEALKSSIAYFESFKQGPMASAVLEDLYSQLEELQGKQEELTEATQVFLGDAIVPLSDAEAEMWQNYGEGIADNISKTKELTDETFNLGEALNTVGTIQNGLEQFTNQMYDNEIEKLTQTEDAKIQAIEDSYDKRLALMDEDSQAYKDLEKDKIEALKDAEDAKHEVVKVAKEKQWKADKAFAVTKSIIDTISAVTEALPNVPLSVVIGALGAANTAAIAAQPMPAFATGGSFTTTGPTPILVGDNTSGQERITVEPVGGNGGNQTMILNIDGQQFMGWMQNQLDNGRLRVPRRILA